MKALGRDADVSGGMRGSRARRRRRVLGLAACVAFAWHAGAAQAAVQDKGQATAQPSLWRILTLPDTYTVLGIRGGRPMYGTTTGTLFQLDTRTGAITPVAPDTRYVGIQSGVERVTILGIDQKGNVLQKNATGVAFYLNRKTGERAFVKWPK
jgi:hypothetical protein